MSIVSQADIVRDMGQRAVNNGGERNYTSEKIGTALIYCAAILRETDHTLDEVLDLARRGYERGM